MIRQLLFALASLLLSKAATADVVFVDLNHVDAEIAVVRAELAKRSPPEKLILLPLDRDAYARNAKSAEVLDEKIQAQSRIYNQQCNDSSTAACQAMQQDYLRLKEQKNAPSLIYDAEALKKDLASIPPGSVSSVMVSGHHVKEDKDHPSQFYGDFGNVSVNGFLDAFKDFSARNNVSSIYLLGCRSAIPQDLGGVWKTAFPNANYIVGYENTGFLKDNPGGHAFIRKALASEKSILASKTTQEAVKKFQAISPRDGKYGTAACITLPGGREPIFISSTKGSSGELSSKLGCAGSSEKVKTAINYMKCVENDRGGSACPLKDVGKMNALAKKECDFQIPDQLDEAVQFRSQQKVLENLMSPDAKINFASIFAKAPESLKKELHLNEPVTSLSEARGKLEAIKKSLDSEFEFNKIKNSDINQLNEMAQKKIFFDTAYLTVSTLDIAQYDELLSSVEYPTTDHGGILRAQAFQQKAQDDKSINYPDRIKDIEAQLGAAQGGPGRSALRQELEALKSLAPTK